MAKKFIKKELILEGLDCANCSAGIEYEANKIKGVKATVNYATKVLSIETECENAEEINDIIAEIGRIANKHEPGIVIKEKVITTENKKTLMLIGLGCVDCAAKIETQVRNLAGVKAASVDFVQKKMVIEAASRQELDSITEEAVKIVKSIEPQVKIVDFNKNTAGNKHEISDEHSKNENIRSTVIKLVIGGSLFLLGIIISRPEWLVFSAFLLSYAITGGSIILRSLKNISRGQIFDENFLMAIATVGAFLIGEYPEGAAVMLFYQIGELFQDAAVDKSRRSITALMDIRPDYANLKSGNELVKVSPDDVAIGDIIVIKPGERVPLDGRIREGASMVDTSPLTGESVPRELTAGDEVLSGSINKNGVLTVEVTREAGESTVSKILELVQNAGSRKAPTESFITKFARYYTPIVVFIAAGIALIPPIIQGTGFSHWFYRALIFLVISCPCALVVSIPLGFFGGIGGASRRGILFKGSNYLEALNNVDTVVFDKTGTLTKGVFKVSEISPQGDITREDLLRLAACAESYSDHPIAASIQKAYGEKVDKNKVEEYSELAGFGVSAKIEGRHVLAGNAKLMEKENISFGKREASGTVVHIAVDRRYAGFIVISDELKDDSAKAVSALKKLGIKTVMLTGDSRSAGEAAGKSLGIDQVYTELLPADKVELLEELDSKKADKTKLVFAGDGINDAPVLARADVGIAMGGLGSDAAIEAADIVIMTDEPFRIVDAIKIAKRTRGIVWQNIIFALGVKIIVLVLGAGGMATMWEAVFADVGVTLLAVLNAMRIMKHPKEDQPVG